MGEFPNEVIEAHARFLADFSELDDHALACIDAANDTFDVERFGQANLGGKFGARPERLVRFKIHSRCADIAERRVQSDFTPGDLHLRLAGVTRMSAALGFFHSDRPFKNTMGREFSSSKGCYAGMRYVSTIIRGRGAREENCTRARWSIIRG